MMPTVCGGSVKGDKKIEPVLKPVTPLKVVPKVRTDDSRNIHGVAAMEGERKLIHISGIAELTEKLEDMSQISIQKEPPRCQSCTRREDSPPLVEIALLASSTFGRVGGEH